MSEPNNKIESPFLRQCVGYLGEVLGAGAMSAFYDRFRETVEVPWFPEFKHGFPYFEIESGHWEFSATPKPSELGIESSAADPLSLTISNTGIFAINEGDGFSTYLKVAIRNPVEIGEILELYSKLTPENSARTTFQQIPWATIIQDVFLLIPSEGKNQLVRLDWNEFKKDWKELWGALLMPIEYFYWDQKDLIPGEDFHDVYSDWESWVNLCTKDRPLVFHDSLKEDDLLYSPSENLHPARTVLQQNENRRYLEPKLVFRLQPQQSRTYFLNFMSHAKEAEGFLTDLTVHHLEDLKQHLKQATVNYPANRLTQIRLATELGAARFAYERKIKSLMVAREPAQEMTSLYIRRNRHATALHSEYLTEIEAHLQPLPYMVEWPLRRYQRADDSLLKIKYGQQLLNILCKLPLFLSLEELQASPENKSICGAIEAKIFTKPASDGTLLECQRDVLKLLDEKKITLLWFGRILARFGSDGIERLGKIVTARNRFHHPPNDEREMLSALEKEIPPVIKILRETMDGLAFITPDSMSFKAGKRVILGRKLMGFESDFLQEEFETTAPFEAFPAGEIVVVNAERTQALALTRLFKRQAIKTVSLDVGMFDRMVAGHPEFVFVRELGEGVV